MGAWLIRVIGLIWLITGILYLVATKRMTLMLSNLLKNTRHQNLGLISLLFGVLLLIFASSAREYCFVRALGIIACLKGVITISIAEQQLKMVINWWLAAPQFVYKMWAAFMLILGITMFCIV